MSVTGTASWGTKFLARAFTSEGMLGFTGCAMAFASGSFALYMNMHGPDDASKAGPHYFTVFAQLSHGQTERVTPAAVTAPSPALAEDIDPVVTGSIPERTGRSTTLPAAVTATSKERPILSNVLLRQIEGNNALVEINDSLVVVKIGDTIPGAGKLMAMTRQGGRPALETSRGLIVESR